MKPRTRIKICGLTREQDVDAAVAAGADAIGFVLYPKSPRHVTPARAAALARRLPPLVTPVLLFVNETAASAQAASALVPGATLQYCGVRGGWFRLVKICRRLRIGPSPSS